MVSKGARGASTRVSIWNFSDSSAASTARRRSGRSGWPAGVKCSRQAGWLMRSVDIATNVGRATPAKPIVCPTLRGECRIGAEYAVAALDYGAFQRARLDREFSAKNRASRERAPPHRRRAVPPRAPLSPKAAPGGKAEQPQVGARAGQRRIGTPCRFDADPAVVRDGFRLHRASRTAVQPKAGSLLAFSASTMPRNSLIATRRRRHRKWQLAGDESIAWMPLVPS